MSTNNRSEAGLVSIMVTMIMMIVITLIVIGFTQITSRNRRTALDQQLSTQAFYAAESGVNQVINSIRSGTAPTVQSSCEENKYGTNTVLSGSPDVRVTCILVKPYVPDLITSVSSGKSSILMVDPSDGNGNSQNINSLRFAWASATGQSNAVGNCSANNATTYRTAATTCGYGLLRMDIMQVDNSSLNIVGAPTYAGTTVSYFIQPTTGGGSATISSFGAPKAYQAAAVCTNANPVPELVNRCTFTLNFGGGSVNKRYYVRLTNMYQDIPELKIDGVTTSGANSYFRNEQILIDATGKAVDVLRRVQVRYNGGGGVSGGIPSGAVQTQADVCKQLTVVTVPGDVRNGLCAP